MSPLIIFNISFAIVFYAMFVIRYYRREPSGLVLILFVTGWSRKRALTAIEELEATNLIRFQSQGELKLRVNVEVL